MTVSRLGQRPIVYVVTDRRQLAPDASERQACAAVTAFAEAVGLAGVDVLQIRERDLPIQTLARLVVSCVRRLEGSQTVVVVNDRLDVALDAGAAGVHLRAHSFPARRVRQVTPAGFVVGRSVHGVDETLSDRNVDYALFGTVYASPSKAPGHRIAGVEALEAAVEVASRPILAIGGVTAERARSLARVGVAGLAGVGLFVDAYRRKPDGTALTWLVGELRRAFDSPEVSV